MRTDVVELLRGSVYDRLQRFSEETGIGVREALNRAVTNYLHDEAPIWREMVRKSKGVKRKK